eukprot:5255505-Alexandrium_andersonii.AAC.1
MSAQLDRNRAKSPNRSRRKLRPGRRRGRATSSARQSAALSAPSASAWPCPALASPRARARTDGQALRRA